MMRISLAAVLLVVCSAGSLHAGKVKQVRTAAAAPSTAIASMSEKLPELWHYLQSLSADVSSGTLRSTDEVIARSRAFFIPARMDRIEAVLPGWGHMASYDRGKTLWHVNVAMVALLQLDEYKAMPREQQIVEEWIVLLHDLAKEPVSGRDHRHPCQLLLHDRQNL